MGRIEWEITIKPNGEISWDIHGMKGKGCKELMDQISFGTEKERRKKPEFYQRVVEKREVKA